MNDDAATRRSWEQPAALFETWPDAMAVAALPDLGWLRTNGTFHRLLGWPIDTLLSMSLRDMAHPQDVAEADVVIDRLLRNEALDRWPLRLRCADGQYLTVVLQATPSIDEGVVYLVGLRGHAAVAHESQTTIDALSLAKEASSLGVHDYDLVSGFISWDERVRELWGVAPDQGVDYETFLLGVHEEDRAATEQAVNRALHPAGDGRYRAEYRVVHRVNGDIRWISATGQVQFDEGKPVRLTGIVEDLTERKLAESRLRASERQFRYTFENAAVGIAHVALNGHWLRLNQRVCDITGYSREELLQLTSDDITHPEDRMPDWENAKRLLAGHIGHYTMEKRCIRKDGRAVWIQKTVGLQRDEDGTPEHFISVIEDISAQKQAEVHREQLMAELRDAQERLRAVVDQMPSGLLIVEAPAGRIEVSNREAERLLGHPAIPSEEVQGYAGYGGVHEDGSRYLPEEYPIARALLNGEVISQEYLLYRRGDGELVHLSVNAVPVQHKGVITGAVCTFNDITRQMQLEHELRAANERLAVALEANRLGTWAWDIESGCILWGGYHSPLFGLDEGEFEGTFEHFLACLHPDDREYVRHEIAGCMAERKAEYCQDYRTVWPDGTVRWLEGRARFYYTPEGKPERMIGVVQDVTDRKETESALDTAQRRLRLALDAARAGTFDISLDPDVPPTVTDGTKRLFGFAREEQPQVEDYFSRVHPEDRPGVERAIEKTAGTREGHYLEYRIVRADGGQCWVASRAEAVADEPGARYPRLVGALIDITERKLAEAALRESEARFRIALHAGSYGVWQWDPASGSIDVDETVRELFALKLTPAPITVQEILETVHPDDRERVQAALRRGLEPGGAYNAEFRVVLPDGAERWLAGFGEVLRDAAGNPTRMVGITRDISERKQAEHSLRRRELELAVERDRLSKVFEQAPAFIAVLRGPELIFELANSAYYRVIGHREIIGKALNEALPELESQGFDKLLQNVIRTGEPFVGTGLPAYVQMTPGEAAALRFFDLVYTAMTEADGTRSGVVAIGSDVTERMNAEEARRVLQEQVARNATEFRQIADSLPQLVWVTRSDGYVEWFNRRWYEYTGTTFEQCEGERWAVFVHPDDVAEVQRCWAHSLQRGERYSVEYRFRRHDGACRWFLAQAEPIRDEYGSVLRWFGTSTDIQDQKDTEDTLRASNEALERFAYSAGHDLQEPLRGITAFAQLLSRRYGDKLEGDAVQYVQHITGSAERMSRLIESLLVYARSASSGALPVQPVDANAALSTATENLRTRIEETGAVVMRDALPAVNAVESLLVQVFQNLIGNSLKYRRPEVVPRVHVTWDRQSDFYVFHVRDNGQGISPEHHEKVFQLFSRLHGRETLGSGIGLATVKRIVERHGGRVWLESEPGVGSTFSFSLPCHVS